MSNLDDFKSFVKDNPILLKYVKNNEMTWQSFYEMYDLYGSDNEVWSKYLNKEDNIKQDKSKYSFQEFINFFKGIDLDNLEDGVKNIQKVLEMIGSISLKDDTTKEYKPRPIYKHFYD